VSDVRRAIARVPGSIGNLGPGLDVLGAALEGGEDVVTATWGDGPGVVITEPGDSRLPREATAHASGIAARSILEQLGVTRGVVLHVRKGLPLSAGQGGSAASAVAGALATAALCGAHDDTALLLRAALEAESAVAGRHLDNLAPSLLGGVVVCRAIDPIDVVHVPMGFTSPVPVALVHPALSVETRRARGVLPSAIDRPTVIAQMANTAAIVAAVATGDLALLGRAIDDRIAEPPRAVLVPGFPEAKRAALRAGALGCSFSGSGPTMFAICPDAAVARMVAEAMAAAFAAQGLEATGWVSAIRAEGATVERFT
jgi:homoserine kinase